MFLEMLCMNSLYPEISCELICIQSIYHFKLILRYSNSKCTHCQRFQTEKCMNAIFTIVWKRKGFNWNFVCWFFRHQSTRWLLSDCVSCFVILSLFCRHQSFRWLSLDNISGVVVQYIQRFFLLLFIPNHGPQINPPAQQKETYQLYNRQMVSPSVYSEYGPVFFILSVTPTLPSMSIQKKNGLVKFVVFFIVFYYKALRKFT